MVKSSRLIDIWLYINNHKKFTTTELAGSPQIAARIGFKEI